MEKGVLFTNFVNAQKFYVASKYLILWLYDTGTLV